MFGMTSLVATRKEDNFVPFINVVKLPGNVLFCFFGRGKDWRIAHTNISLLLKVKIIIYNHL